MTPEEKQSILENAKAYFRDVIIASHLENARKCHSLAEFKYNPFLIRYLASLFNGSITPITIAKALIYPRILGTSITTSFGTKIQQFITNVLPHSCGSLIDGMDIEFIDALDGRKKFCQVKAGPQTINSGDVQPIKNSFRHAKNLARTNNYQLNDDDMVVGVLYGHTLTSFYQQIAEDYPVYVGKDFWYHLTGDLTFYDQLCDAFKEVAEEGNYSLELNNIIEQLADEIAQNGL